MADISTNFNAIKHQLESLSYSQERFEQKISQITQTRNKINNEVVNLTKDYERKIKQLQSKLDEAFSKNQTLLKQNKLYKKDIQAFQTRLIQKQKLIAMLILQQNQRFTVDVRNKSQLFDKGERANKKNMQSILPKSILNKQPSHERLPPKQQEDKKQQSSTKKEQIMDSEEVYAHQKSKPEHYNTEEPIAEPVESSNKNELDEGQIKEELQQVNSEVKQPEKVVAPARKVLPPPPAKGKKKIGAYPIIQMPEPEPEAEAEQIQQPNFESEPKPGLIKDTNFNSPFDKQNEHVDVNQQNIFEKLSKRQQQEQPKQQKHSRGPPPPPPQKKSRTANPPPPKKKVNNVPQFLQDHQQPASENSAFDNQNFYQNQGQIKVVEEREEVLFESNLQPVPEEKPQVYEHYNHPQPAQNFEAPQKYEQPQQNVEAEENFRAPPSNKMVKPSKKKAKSTIKSINQANFYEQTSNSHEQSRQTQSNNIQTTNQPVYSYEATPSSQDFFAQFGANTADNQQQSASKSHHSHIMEAQESSIDYADSHSVISSTAAHMFDSQYFPEQQHQTTNISTEVKKMSKKKNTKREIKQLAPGLFN